MVLADLHAVNRPADLGGAGDIAGLGQRGGDPFGGRLDVVVRRAVGRGDLGQDGVDPLPGERLNRLFAADLAKLPHGRRRQVVVGVVELGPTAGGQPVALRGTPAPRLLPCRGGRGLGIAGLDQGVEVPAHTGGRQAQPVTDLARGDRSGFQQQAHDGTAGVTIRARSADVGRDDAIGAGSDFHNTSVTQFRRSV